jgi:hypothetical protein
MTKSSYYAVALGLAGCLGAVSARGVGAQEVSPPRWRIAWGTDLREHSRPGAGNFIGLVGREWQRPGSRVSWRLDLLYQRSAQSDDGLGLALLGCGLTCRGENESQRLALEGDVKVELTRGAVRPYLASGLGIYRSVETLEQNYTCGGFGEYGAGRCQLLTGPATKIRDGGAGLGLHAGFGVAAVFGRTHVFGELRFLSLSDAPNSSWRAPFVIGLRF